MDGDIFATMRIGFRVGDQSIQRHALQMAESNPNKDCLLAFGLLGDCTSVSLLISHLAEKKLADIASLSLNLITGANLIEEIFIPESIDEEDFFDEEIEKIKNGESLYPPGEEPGETVERISHNSEQWKSWWSKNKLKFRQDLRYRVGKPYSPGSLIDTLDSFYLSDMTRKLVYEELVIRYNADIPFETDTLVAKQILVIDKYRKWDNNTRQRYKPGLW